MKCIKELTAFLHSLYSCMLKTGSFSCGTRLVSHTDGATSSSYPLSSALQEEDPLASLLAFCLLRCSSYVLSLVTREANTWHPCSSLPVSSLFHFLRLLSHDELIQLYLTIRVVTHVRSVLIFNALNQPLKLFLARLLQTDLKHVVTEVISHQTSEVLWV